MMTGQFSANTLSDEYVVVENRPFEVDKGSVHLEPNSHHHLNDSHQVTAEDFEKLRNWLSPTDYGSESVDLKRHLAARTGGTCQWLQTCAEFCQ